jgi:hypothetical protein
MYFLSVAGYNPQNVMGYIFTVANGLSWIVTSNRITILCPALHGLYTVHTRTSGPLFIGLVLHIL